MKKYRVFAIGIIFTLILTLVPVGNEAAGAQAPAPEITRETLYVPGEVVVGFDRGLPQPDVQARAEALAGPVGALVVDLYANLALLSVDPTADVAALAEQLSDQDGVVFAAPNYISWIPEADPLGEAVQLSEITRHREDGAAITRSIEELKVMRTIIRGKVKSTYPNDEFHNWGNAQIGHDIIWPNRNSSPMVCVIDTGVDNKHPDLKGRIINGYDFINNDKVPNDDNGHGTHVAGTIAAKTGNGIGPAGISNGKVLAVKALNAQGWGTDFDIASAIYYCANNKSVKVINMSLGGSVPTSGEYNALDYAINTMGKLVVAAAGNESTSNYSYPAGWAKDATIGHGLLSVGASRMPTEWLGYDLWVDENGDGIEDGNELYSTDNCAAGFSNYGDWVEMIAPGESIYSTLPVSYPFWNNYFGSSSSGYDSWNGTSMAVPHVAGAAARAWSFYRAESNTWIHDRLLGSGFAPVTAEDPNMPDSTLGYNNPGYGEIDEETIKAPFCWPDSMSGASFLSVAAAMDRGAFSVEVTDAATGLPLTGATITVKHGLTRKKITVAKMTSMTTRFVDLINIPAQDPAEDLVGHPIYVNRKGYTAGNQIFSFGWVPSPGYYWWGIGFQVGVPPKKGTSVVANWNSGYDLDLYAWLPAPTNTVVGSPTLEHPSWNPGTLIDFPRTRWHRDGGGGDYLGVEAITMVNYPRSQYPYSLGVYPNESYQFLLHEHGESWDNLNDAEPIARIWNNGKNIPLLLDDDLYHYYLEKTDPCAEDETWWKVATIIRNGKTPLYLPQDVCGTGSADSGGVWPYAEGIAISSTSQEP